MNDFQVDQAKVLRRIRVLVVDDSASCRDLLVAMINGDPRLQVAGVAVNGEEAVRAAAQLAPDIVTMDLHMPRMDGFAATRRIMETCPTRVVVVTSSFVPQDVAQSFHALEYDGVTYDCGDKIGLLRANVALALKDPELGAAARAALSPFFG